MGQTARAGKIWPFCNKAGFSLFFCKAARHNYNAVFAVFFLDFVEIAEVCKISQGNHFLEDVTSSWVQLNFVGIVGPKDMLE